MDALVGPLVLTLLLIVPCAVLTVAGVLLWRRWRSVATALVALGFAMALLGLASVLFATYKTRAVLSELTSAATPQHDTGYIVAHYRGLLLVAVLGKWVAAAGALWHVRRQRYP